MGLENKKKASTIVCTYNREQSLRHTLSDLIHQDCNDVEIIQDQYGNKNESPFVLTQRK